MRVDERLDQARIAVQVFRKSQREKTDSSMQMWRMICRIAAVYRQADRTVDWEMVWGRVEEVLNGDPNPFNRTPPPDTEEDCL